MLLDPECQPSPHSLHRLLCPVSLLLSSSLTLLFFGLLARKLGLQLPPMSYTNHIHALVQGQAAEVLTEGEKKKQAYLPQPFGTTASSVKEVSLPQFQVLSIQLSPLPVTTATQDCLGMGCERIEKKRRGSRGFLSTSSLLPLSFPPSPLSQSFRYSPSASYSPFELENFFWSSLFPCLSTYHCFESSLGNIAGKMGISLIPQYFEFWSLSITFLSLFIFQSSNTCFMYLPVFQVCLHWETEGEVGLFCLTHSQNSPGPLFF